MEILSIGLGNEGVGMTEREALRLALEALEELNKLSIGEHAICLPAEIDTAMDAIKQALEQPEPEPVAYASSVDWRKNQLMSKAQFDNCLPKNRMDFDVPLYTSPPKRESEPEPVGYLIVTDPWGAPEYHFSVEKKEGYFNEPVYKHPPKREPQEPVECMCGICKLGKREPLTHEQIYKCEIESGFPNYRVAFVAEIQAFARAIEQAHGIGDKK
jgi:hypothetical protein